MAGIWYRRGTVSLTNGSAVVNGAGVTWNDPAGGVQVGNIFFGPDGKAYEVAYVLSATQLQLASNYGGPTATAQPYAIVTPIVGSIPALSTKVAAVLGYAQGQYDSWQQILTGTGDVTLTAPDGSTITVPSLNGIAANKLDKTGTAAAATKLATARTLTIGNTGKTFDGAANQSWSLGEIGALPLTGGVLTGNLSVESTYPTIALNTTSGDASLVYKLNNAWRWLQYLQGSSGDLITSGYDASGGNGKVFSRMRYSDNSVTFSGPLAGTSASFAGTVTPTTDNVRTLGTASLRWSTVYAGTGTINTSDAREKTAVTPLNDAEIAAAIDICNNIGTYQWLESIENKTEDVARHHVGLTVQRAIEIMEAHGLEPFRYGFICYDAWEAEYQDVDEEAGDLVRTVERPVTRSETRTSTEIKVIDGVPTQVTTVTTEQIPVYEDKAVVDGAGNPVLVNHPAEFDEDGGIIREAYSTALTHPVPVMESVEVRYRRDVVREAGDRYSFRMDQLALFCLCGMAQSS